MFLSPSINNITISRQIVLTMLENLNEQMFCSKIYFYIWDPNSTRRSIEKLAVIGQMLTHSNIPPTQNVRLDLMVRFVLQI